MSPQSVDRVSESPSQPSTVSTLDGQAEPPAEGNEGAMETSAAAETAAASSAAAGLSPTAAHQDETAADENQDRAPAAPATDQQLVAGDSAAIQTAPNVVQRFEVTLDDIADRLIDKGYFNEGLIERLHEILMWSDPATNTFSIHRLPDNLVWEVVQDGKASDSNLLHVRGSTSPCIAWIAGHVVSTWFLDSPGRPVARPALVVTPLFDDALTVARRFLGTVPASATSTRTMEESLKQIRASTFSTARIRGKAAAQPVKFRHIYDGVNPPGDRRYPVTGLRSRLQPADVLEGDLVLMEVCMSRFKDSGNQAQGDSKGKRADTSAWRKVYELRRVTLLGKCDSSDSDAAVADDDN